LDELRLDEARTCARTACGSRITAREHSIVASTGIACDDRAVRRAVNEPMSVNIAAPERRRGAAGVSGSEQWKATRVYALA
jgi:hypothetical protein